MVTTSLGATFLSRNVVSKNKELRTAKERRRLFSMNSKMKLAEKMTKITEAKTLRRRCLGAIINPKCRSVSETEYFPVSGTIQCLGKIGVSVFKGVYHGFRPAHDPLIHVAADSLVEDLSKSFSSCADS